MAVLTEYFAANQAELAALSIEWGPAPPPPQPPKAKGGFLGLGKRRWRSMVRSTRTDRPCHRSR